MHEYALTQQIIQTSEDYARQKGGSRVVAIDLVIGEASGCVAEAIALYFDLMAEDSLCAEAVLHITRVKPLLKCQRCGKLFQRKPFSFACDDTACDGEGAPTEIGREFYIRAIDIEI